MDLWIYGFIGIFGFLNFWIYGFDSHAKKDFSEVEWKGDNVLLFGSEGFGLNQKTEKFIEVKFSRGFKFL